MSNLDNEDNGYSLGKILLAVVVGVVVIVAKIFGVTDPLEVDEQGINDGGILIGVKSKSEDDQRRIEKDWRVNHDNQVNA